MSPDATTTTTFVTDAEIYRRVILELVPQAKRFVWLATADLKDLHVAAGRRMIPFLEVLAGLAERGVALRLLHAKEPGPNFRRDFDRFPVLIDGLERILCPRVHLKSVIVDGSAAYSGSANLTGAGMGAKSDGRRNFEAGIVTTDPALVRMIIQNLFGNAIEYTRIGGKIVCMAMKIGEKIIVGIKDTGIGIPEEQKTKIFQKLFRAENAILEKPEGNGLELYITKGMVDALSGQIWFESEKGAGTTFFVALSI